MKRKAVQREIMALEKALYYKSFQATLLYQKDKYNGELKLQKLFSNN
jgi:hypothetical protein